MASMTKSINNLVETALAIESEAASEAGTLAFMARVLVQTTLLHKKIDAT